jgi:hypothetical protein
LVPSAEKAVEKEAANEVVDVPYKFRPSGIWMADWGNVGAGRERVDKGVNERRAEPEMRWRWTLEESPTDRRVRPSGEREAKPIIVRQVFVISIRGNIYVQWLTGTFNCIQPISSSLSGGLGLTYDALIETSKNLTVQSLLLTANLGSTLDWLERVRLREERRTELLMEARSWSSKVQIEVVVVDVPAVLERERRSGCDEDDVDGVAEEGEETGRWRDKWISASWPPAARSVQSVPGTCNDASVFGVNDKSTNGCGFCSPLVSTDSCP